MLKSILNSTHFGDGLGSFGLILGNFSITLGGGFQCWRHCLFTVIPEVGVIEVTSNVDLPENKFFEIERLYCLQYGTR